LDFPDPTPVLQDANAWAMRAGFLAASQCYGEATVASERALAIDPNHFAAMRVAIYSRLFACDWNKREEDKRRILTSLKAGKRLLNSIEFRRICEPEEESLIAARLWAMEYPMSAEPVWRADRYRHDKIRIAYVSTDFRDHVVSDAIVGCFEHHDKLRFETTAISLGPDDGSEMQRRTRSAFDRVIDAQALSDAEIAAGLRELEIDIAVDLNGQAGAHRTGIFALRPTPLQVNYLGYPGTMGATFIDYIIADRIVIPDQNQIYYDEQVVYLPHTYMPNDGQRKIAEEMPSRIKAGLPETGFVFACHNDERKIGPEIFDTWMRLLQTVEGSVLWLKSLNPSAMGNLWREAKLRGVAPGRLIFAPRMPRTEDHLARLPLADLFLDTLPYNAHATACDALWAGLPVLTCRGKSFPGLVGASLLHAIGLPELVTTSLHEYEQLALALARDRERLAAIKAKLMRNRLTEPLFDTARFTRDLESAYTTMWERQQAGLAPASFAVATAS
jgi:protein O-GlcNAc transferase